MSETSDFVRVFRAAAHQLNRLETARTWAGFAQWLGSEHNIVLTAATAAAWANLGYMPREALPLIADGVSPETAGEMEDLATQIAGGVEQRRTDRIAELERGAGWLGPSKVRWREDPDDPEHIIVDIDVSPEEDRNA